MGRITVGAKNCKDNAQYLHNTYEGVYTVDHAPTNAVLKSDGEHGGVCWYKPTVLLDQGGAVMFQ